MVLTGLNDEALLTRVDCETEEADEEHGVLLRVPPALYRDMAKRLAAIGQSHIGLKNNSPSMLRNIRTSAALRAG